MSREQAWKIKLRNVAKFNTLGYAKEYAWRAAKSMVVMMGDDDLLWVVTLGMMERLLKEGYEIAE